MMWSLNALSEALKCLFFPKCGTVQHLCTHQVGIEADADWVNLLSSQVSGKDITELIAAGREKLASVPAGGGAVAVAAAPASGAAAEPAKEEKKVEEKEESDDDMGFSLFN